MNSISNIGVWLAVALLLGVGSVSNAEPKMDSNQAEVLIADFSKKYGLGREGLNPIIKRVSQTAQGLPSENEWIESLQSLVKTKKGRLDKKEAEPMVKPLVLKVQDNSLQILKESGPKYGLTMQDFDQVANEMVDLMDPDSRAELLEFIKSRLQKTVATKTSSMKLNSKEAETLARHLILASEATLFWNNGGYTKRPAPPNDTGSSKSSDRSR